MDQKRCPGCQATKPVSEFNRMATTPDGLQPRCRACQSGWYHAHKSQHVANVTRNRKRYREENARRVLDYLADHPCVDCGESDPVVLDFDHRGDEGKSANVSDLLSRTRPWERILSEIAKCDVRCANCHRRMTAARHGGWLKSLLTEP